MKLKSDRIKEDGIASWIPYAKQADFIESVLRRFKRNNWFIAANRSGKSDAGAYAGAILARFGTQITNERLNPLNPGTIDRVSSEATSGWVVSLDFPSSRDIIQPKYFNNGFSPPSSDIKPFIPDHEIADWRKQDQILKLKNGSLIGFKSADSGRKKFQGTEKEWVHFDEEPPMEIYDECVIRVGSKPLTIFGTCTMLPPEGQIGGVSWLWDKVIEPYLQYGSEFHTALFGASIYDNPHIPREEIGNLEAIYPEGTPQRRIRLNGEWIPGIGGARAYASFDASHHVGDQSRYWDKWAPIHWCWDFNVSPMVSLIGQRIDGKFRVHRELIMEDGKIVDMCELFKNLYRGHRCEVYVYGDATGNSRTAQTGETSYHIIQNAMMDFGTPVKIKLPEKNPPVVDRLNTFNYLLKDEQGMSKVYVDRSCKELIADLNQVLLDNTGSIKKTRSSKDPYYRRTHTSDAMGYWLHYEEPVIINRNRGLYGREQNFRLNVPKPLYDRRESGEPTALMSGVW